MDLLSSAEMGEKRVFGGVIMSSVLDILNLTCQKDMQTQCPEVVGHIGSRQRHLGEEKCAGVTDILIVIESLK